jgi:hypothetical protein
MLPQTNSFDLFGWSQTLHVQTLFHPNVLFPLSDLPTPYPPPSLPAHLKPSISTPAAPPGVPPPPPLLTATALAFWVVVWNTGVLLLVLLVRGLWIPNVAKAVNTCSRDEELTPVPSCCCDWWSGVCLGVLSWCLEVSGARGGSMKQSINEIAQPAILASHFTPFQNHVAPEPCRE